MNDLFEAPPTLQFAICQYAIHDFRVQRLTEGLIRPTHTMGGTKSDILACEMTLIDAVLSIDDNSILEATLGRSVQCSVGLFIRPFKQIGP
jgi:hypothetical protein